jgi:hypothetical protein
VKFRTTDIMEVDSSVLTTRNIYAGTTTTFPQSLWPNISQINMQIHRYCMFTDTDTTSKNLITLHFLHPDGGCTKLNTWNISIIASARQGCCWKASHMDCLYQMFVPCMRASRSYGSAKAQPLRHSRSPHRPAFSWWVGPKICRVGWLSRYGALWTGCSTWRCSWLVRQRVVSCSPTLALCMSRGCHITHQQSEKLA